MMKHLRPAILLVLLYLPAQVMAQGLPYHVAYAGADESLSHDLQAVSLLDALKANPPDTEAGLHRLAQQDITLFTDLLNAHGYFSNKVTYTLDMQQTPANIVFHIITGPVYTLQGYQTHWSGPGAQATQAYQQHQQAAEKLTIPLGKNLQEDMLQKTEQQILALAMQNGHPFPEVIKRTLALNHTTHTANVTLWIDTGPQAVFGTTHITGIESVDDGYIKRRIDWVEGAPFDLRKVTDSQQTLSRTSVINTARVSYDKNELSADGHLPMNVALKEGDRRSIGVGAFVSSSAGPYGQVFWEHRNMFGNAENLRIKADLGTERRGLTFDLTKPDLFNSRQYSLQLSAANLAEKLEAYDRKTTSAAAALKWQITNHIVLTGGGNFESTRITEADKTGDTFTLSSFPMSARYDNTDDFFNPTRGLRLLLALTPTQSLESNLHFLTTDATASMYLPITKSLVWANRGRVATIGGANLASIPADKRLYAGGSGSVRGYAYQLLGPLDATNKPTGGRFLTELATEARYRFTDTIGGVAFFEGARLTQNRNVSGSEPFRWSAGLGARYQTPIGPVRFDIAVPLDKRPVDDSFQFYISLGHAF